MLKFAFENPVVVRKDTVWNVPFTAAFKGVSCVFKKSIIPTAKETKRVIQDRIIYAGGARGSPSADSGRDRFFLEIRYKSRLQLHIPNADRDLSLLHRILHQLLRTLSEAVGKKAIRLILGRQYRSDRFGERSDFFHGFLERRRKISLGNLDRDRFLFRFQSVHCSFSYFESSRALHDVSALSSAVSFAASAGLKVRCSPFCPCRAGA